jgi:hypothetical protein
MKRSLTACIAAAMLATPVIAGAKVQGSGGPIADATLMRRRVERDYRAEARAREQHAAARRDAQAAVRG